MRLLKLSLILLIMISICQKSSAHYDYLYLKDFKNTTFYQNLNLQSSEIIESIIMVPNHNFNHTSASEMIKRIDSLPHALLNKIRDHSIVLVLFTGSLTNFSTMKSFKGLTPRGYADTTVTWDDVPGAGGTRKVFAKIGASEKGSGHSSVNLELHELAHSIDKIVFDKIREQTYFLTIWRLEVSNLFPNNDYFLLYPEEYFAETFAMYYINKQTKNMLKEKAPKTFKFIDRLN